MDFTRGNLRTALCCAVVFAGFAVQAQDAVRVKAAAPTKAVFERSHTVQGTIDARNTASVSARISGNLDEIWVDEGDVVAAGETRLFQIDPVNAYNQVVIAEQTLAVAKSGLAVSEANLLKIKAEADKAAADFARYERLHKEGRVTDNEFEVRQTANAQAAAGLAVGKAQIELSKQQVAQAEAQLGIARKGLSDSLIKAPISGVVSARNAEPGEFISSGSAVLKIVDTNALEVAAFIPAQYFAEVKPGVTKARVAVAGAAPVEVPVSFKSPVIDTTLRTFELKGLLSGGDALAPGMMADVSVVFEAREGIGVPAGAVLTRGGKTVVFVVENGKAVQKEVKTGFHNGGSVEILGGLAEGDKVIYEGHTLVRDGLAVNVM